MIGYIGQRLMATLGTALIVATIVFLGSQVLPGGPADLRGGIDASREEIAELRKALGLDRSLPSQYLSYLTGIFQGDLGLSIREGRPVSEILLERGQVTLSLAALSFSISFLLGITLGTLAAFRPESSVDAGIAGFSMIGLALPEFWIGIILVLAFAVRLKWFPFMGIAASGQSLIVQIHHLILPALTLSIPRASILVRLTRANILEEMPKMYVLAARARGLTTRRIAVHVLRGALPGSLQLAALELGGLLSGTILVEQVFGLPGLGSALLGALSARDYPVVVGISLVAVFAYALANLVADISQAALDPRISSR
ncbi:MAG: ABC transporter permease [bacterium]